MSNFQNHPLSGAKDLDSAMSILWSFYKKYFAGIYIISLLAALFSGLISASLDISGFQSTPDPDEALALLKDMAGPYTLLIVVSLIMGVVLHAYILEKPSGTDIGSILKDSVLALVPFLLVAIILGIGGTIMLGIGFVMLVLPGIFGIFYFATIFIFALPVTLVEGNNPGKILSRTLQLSHKNFWPNMGWVAVAILLVLIISLIISAIAMLPFTGTFFSSFSHPENSAALLELGKNPLYIGLSAVTTAFITPVFPILAFILYFRNSGDEETVVINPEEQNRVTVEDLYPKMPEKE